MWTQEDSAKLTTSEVYAELRKLHGIKYHGNYFPYREPPQELNEDLDLFRTEFSNRVQLIKYLVNCVTPEFMEKQRMYLNVWYDLNI